MSEISVTDFWKNREPIKSEKRNLSAKEAADFKYVNREQDLGVPGLRKSKESYHPCTMIKKYNLSAQ